MELVYTLVSDGSSDAALRLIIEWLLEQTVTVPFSGERADLGRLRNPPKTLKDRIKSAVTLYPCDVLIVHRDAEKLAREKRVREIRSAADAAFRELSMASEPPVVCAVPVRMTEAWLLLDSGAIAAAVGSPGGRLHAPPLQTLESIADPKRVLQDLLRDSSPLGARRRRQLDPHALMHRVASQITDFSPLRALPAFAAFEEELLGALRGRLSARE